WNAVKAVPAIEEFCTQHPGMVLYGEVGPVQKGYRYGADKGEVWFYAFDVYDSNTGEWHWPGALGFAPTVPILHVGPYDLDVVNQIVDGKSVIPGADNLREGVVVSSRERRRKLKIHSNLFLEAK